MMEKNRNNFLRLTSLLIAFGLIVSSCSSGIIVPEEIISSEQEQEQYKQSLPYTEAEIILEIPKPTEYEIVFELVDDITGIELNPTRYVMDKVDDNHYQLVLPIQVPALIKYRFYKNNGLPIYETNSENKIIEYRMAYVSNEVIINNQLTNWHDEQYDHKYGRATGQVVNLETNSPIPNALVVIGGIHSYTNSLGNFIVERLPPGKHNLVITSTDGEYKTFQQEALIGEGLTTPASIGLEASRFVKISFIVQPPANHPEQAPMRILGNTYQLGNVFGNIYNGTSIAPARAPKLTYLPDGNYSITMNMPSGYDLRYKYSLGDGFWNAELDSNNNFIVRKFVVPDQDTIVNDVIGSWNSIDAQSVEFTVNIPEDTPETDKISIQFNSFGWSPPIPMWESSNSQWKYQLFGPFHLVSKIDYRICRNDACEVSADASAPVNGYSFDTNTLPQTLNVEVTDWKGWGLDFDNPTLDPPEIVNRGESFVAGFEFSDEYNVSTPIYIDSAYKNIVEVSGNTAIIPIKWTLQSINPVIFEPQTGQNPLWKDLVLIIQKAQKQNLNVWLSPEVEISTLAIKQLGQEELPNSWVQQFSSVYGEFLFYAADLANYMNIQGVIFPTNIIHLPNLSNYETLSDAMITSLLSNMDILKTRFTNNLFISFSDIEVNNVDLLNSVDGFVITPSVDFINSEYVGEDHQSTYKNYLEEVIYINYSQYEKPIFIGINFPSASGSDYGCIEIDEQCLEFEVVNNLEISSLENSIEIDLYSQIDLIHAAFLAINETDWVSGIISQDYNPLVAILDHGSSVRGKPSIGVYWYWFPRMLGIIN